MRVNTGGDPGRDDYGLPPVDVEVPDDARELDSDVQAYYRELRSLRRRNLARRLCGPLTRDGMVLPLFAGCLALTLLAATLLTVFTVGQGTVSGPLARSEAVRSGAGLGGAQLSSRTPATPAPVAGTIGAPLPDATVVAGGEPETLRQLTGPVLVLALIPPSCQCFRDLRQLFLQASAAGAETYLVGTGGAQVAALDRRLGLSVMHAVEDSQNSLPAAYHTAQLTAVLVRADGSVAGWVHDKHGFRIEKAVSSLSSTHLRG
jgi:hypothetical protein